MQQPMSFFPEKRDVDTVPLEVHNALIEEYEKVQAELVRCRQKIAHLLKEKEKA